MPITLPQNTDYLEAIQTPQASFQDPELRQARPELDTIGLPRARSGNFADVYQLRGAPGKAWAVKCFTREAQDLQQRYHAIFNHLQQANLAFTVQFEYLAQGIRVKGQWYPIVKMSWVEGLTLSEFIKEHVDKPQLLIALSEMWIKLAQQLRKAGVAHGDLQHGNVMLISGTKASSLLLRLIDYDGMFVPALSQTRSGEVGHPNYQHPHRLRDGTYNGEVDRFAHLVIHCALRCLAVGGRQLWERYDNLDNLLFREKDFQSPVTSPLFQDLWKSPDPAVRALVGRLLLASQMPLEQVPLLEDLAGAEKQYQLAPAQERQVQALLNARAGQVGQVPDLRAAPSPVQAAPAKPLTPAPEPPATDLIGLEPASPRAPASESPGLGEREDKARRRRKRRKRSKSSSSLMRSLILRSMDLYAVISNNATYLALPLLFFVCAGGIGLVMLLATRPSTSWKPGESVKYSKTGTPQPPTSDPPEVTSEAPSELASTDPAGTVQIIGKAESGFTAKSGPPDFAAIRGADVDRGKSLRASTDPAEILEIVGEVAPGFTARVPVIPGGVAIVAEHFGRTRVLSTHPLNPGTPCILTSTIEVPGNKRTTLTLDVSHSAVGNWQLIVLANGERLYDGTVGLRTARKGWLSVSVDLTRFADRQVVLELQNKARRWSHDWGFWHKVKITAR